MHLKRKASAGGPRPKGRSRKNLTEPHGDGCEELLKEITNKLSKEISNKRAIRTNKNIEGQEVAMSLTKTNSKIYEPES